MNRRQAKAEALPAVDPKRYCGIVFIGGGSSWAWAPTIEEAARKAAKMAKADWSALFKFKRKEEFRVNVYDMEKHSGWYATDGGVFAQGTQERLTPCQRVTVEA